MDRGWGCASSTCGHIVAYMYVFRLSSLEAGQRDDTDFVKWQEEMKQASLFVWCVCVCVCMYVCVVCVCVCVCMCGVCVCVCMYVWCVCERDPHPEGTLTLMLPCVHMYVCVHVLYPLCLFAARNCSSYGSD